MAEGLQRQHRSNMGKREDFGRIGTAVGRGRAKDGNEGASRAARQEDKAETVVDSVVELAAVLHQPLCAFLEGLERAVFHLGQGFLALVLVPHPQRGRRKRRHRHRGQLQTEGEVRML